MFGGCWCWCEGKGCGSARAVQGSCLCFDGTAARALEGRGHYTGISTGGYLLPLARPSFHLCECSARFSAVGGNVRCQAPDLSRVLRTVSHAKLLTQTFIAHARVVCSCPSRPAARFRCGRCWAPAGWRWWPWRRWRRSWRSTAAWPRSCDSATRCATGVPRPVWGRDDPWVMFMPSGQKGPDANGPFASFAPAPRTPSSHVVLSRPTLFW